MQVLIVLLVVLCTVARATLSGGRVISLRTSSHPRATCVSPRPPSELHTFQNVHCMARLSCEIYFLTYISCSRSLFLLLLIINVYKSKRIKEAHLAG
jgi:hypothetical protein